MKALKCFAVCTALLVMGACSTAPSQEETDFLNAVAKKTLVMGGADFAKFSGDGRKAELIPASGGYGKFENAESALIAVYQSYSADDKKQEGVGSKYKAVLKSDKTGGEMLMIDANGKYPAVGSGLPFTFK